MVSLISEYILWCKVFTIACNLSIPLHGILNPWKMAMNHNCFPNTFAWALHGRLICYTCMARLGRMDLPWLLQRAQIIEVKTLWLITAQCRLESEIMKLTVTVWWVLIVAHRALLHPASLLATSLITFPYKTLPSWKTQRMLFLREFEKPQKLPRKPFACYVSISESGSKYEETLFWHLQPLSSSPP